MSSKQREKPAQENCKKEIDNLNSQPGGKKIYNLRVEELFEWSRIQITHRINITVGCYFPTLNALWRQHI